MIELLQRLRSNISNGFVGSCKEIARACLDFTKLDTFFPSFELSLHALNCNLPFRNEHAKREWNQVAVHQLPSLFVDGFDNRSIGTVTEFFDSFVPYKSSTLMTIQL